MKSSRKLSEERCFPSTLMVRGTSGSILTAALKKASAEREKHGGRAWENEKDAEIRSFIFSRAHPGTDTGWRTRPAQRGGRGWDGWKCCWETGWWWSCKLHTPGEKQKRAELTLSLSFEKCFLKNRSFVLTLTKAAVFLEWLPLITLLVSMASWFTAYKQRKKTTNNGHQKTQCGCVFQKEGLILTWMSCTRTGSRLQKVALASTQKLNCCSKSRPNDTCTSSQTKRERKRTIFKQYWTPTMFKW